MADGNAKLGLKCLLDEKDELNQVDHLKVGSYYELEHSRLPPNVPIQLWSIRIVMVCSKNARGVTVRYPSTFALESHFKVGGGDRSGALQKPNLSPAMDDEYTMGFRVAAEALFKRIEPEEYVDGCGLWRFWTASPLSDCGKSFIGRRPRGRVDIKKEAAVKPENGVSDCGMQIKRVRDEVQKMRRHLRKVLPVKVRCFSAAAAPQASNSNSKFRRLLPKMKSGVKTLVIIAMLGSSYLAFEDSRTQKQETEHQQRVEYGKKCAEKKMIADVKNEVTNIADALKGMKVQQQQPQ